MKIIKFILGVFVWLCNRLIVRAVVLPKRVSDDYLFDMRVTKHHHTLRPQFVRYHRKARRVGFVCRCGYRVTYDNALTGVGA